jgi:propanol-preferring alcohol dehydrogenase
MRALEFVRPGAPLALVERDLPEPGPGEIRVRVEACGVCRTDLHLVDGELRDPRPRVVPGHQIVGRVEQRGAGVLAPALGSRVGVPWLGSTCERCDFCRSDAENLCDRPGFTGYTRDGGFADHAIADARFCFPLSDAIDPAHAAPLLCAGLIGYRSLRLAGNARRLGLYGFGAAAHLAIQVARYRQQEVFVFTRTGDAEAQRFARELGAAWTGSSDERPPAPLDAAILFAPVGALVPAALSAVRKGGSVICGGIHMSDIPSFAYSLLWEERVLRSVANLTRRDGHEFLELAARIPVRTEIERFPLASADAALARVRSGALRGAAVLVTSD